MPIMTSRFQSSKFILFVTFHFILHDECCRLYLRPKVVPVKGEVEMPRQATCCDTMLFLKEFPGAVIRPLQCPLGPNSGISMQPRNQSMFYYPVSFVNPTLRARRRCLDGKNPSYVSPPRNREPRDQPSVVSIGSVAFAFAAANLSAFQASICCRKSSAGTTSSIVIGCRVNGSFSSERRC